MRIRLTRCFATTPAALFALLHDYEQRGRWDTFVPDARVLTGPVACKGAVVRCRDRLGLSMDTLYVGFQPPYLATVRLVKGPWVFQSFAGSWRISEAGEGCRLDVSYNLKTRPRALRLMLEPLVGLVFWLQTYWRLRALARYVA